MSSMDEPDPSIPGVTLPATEATENNNDAPVNDNGERRSYYPALGMPPNFGVGPMMPGMMMPPLLPHLDESIMEISTETAIVSKPILRGDKRSFEIMNHPDESVDGGLLHHRPVPSISEMVPRDADIIPLKPSGAKISSTSTIPKSIPEHNGEEQRSCDASATVPKFIPKPKGKEQRSYDAFIHLPETDRACASVDSVDGKWYICGVCKLTVSCRVDCLFTVSRWNDHVKCATHIANEYRKLERKKLLLNQTSKDGKLSKIDQTTLTQLNKSCQLNMRNFFTPTAKKTCGATPSVEVEVEVEASTTKTSGIRSWASKMAPVSCQGIMPDYQNSSPLSQNLQVYCRYCSVDDKSKYCIKFVGDRPQLFSKLCTHGMVVFVKVIIVLIYIRVIIALN